MFNPVSLVRMFLINRIVTIRVAKVWNFLQQIVARFRAGKSLGVYYDDQGSDKLILVFCRAIKSMILLFFINHPGMVGGQSYNAVLLQERNFK